MKFLVLGCNGMAGHVISLYLEEQGHDVTGYARQKSRFVKTVVSDVTNFERLSQTIHNGAYDSVINCVGLLNQFAENDHASAILINAYLPHFLVKITEDTDTQVIHMSTDCVFSGRTGRYTEDSVQDGTLFYDRSKAAGEINDKKNITLRNSIVGPDLKEDGIGLLNWFMQQKGQVHGYRKAIWTGQTTLQLAKTMEKVAEERVHGLYNMVPDSSISKYELLKLFDKYLRKDKIEIIPSDKVTLDKSLKRTNWEFDYPIPDYEQMISEMADWMREHRELYPHYNL